MATAAETARQRRHNRKAPKLLPRWRNEKVPPMLKLAVEKLQELYPLRGKDGDPLHQLLRRRRGRGEVCVSTSCTGTKCRKIHRYNVTRKRSDHTEAQHRVLIFQVEHCDVADGLVVGQFNKKLLKIDRGFTLEEYARACEMQRPSQRYPDKPNRCRSDSTLDRVLQELLEAEFNWPHQPIETVTDDDGKPLAYKGGIAERKLTIGFFATLLETTEEQVKVRMREAKDHRHNQRKQLDRQSPVAPVGTLVSTMVDPAIRDLRPDTPAGIEGADLPQFHKLQWEVHGQHPDWSADDVTAEAARRLQRTKPPPDRR